MTRDETIEKMTARLLCISPTKRCQAVALYDEFIAPLVKGEDEVYCTCSGDPGSQACAPCCIAIAYGTARPRKKGEDVCDACRDTGFIGDATDMHGRDWKVKCPSCQKEEKKDWPTPPPVGCFACASNASAVWLMHDKCPCCGRKKNENPRTATEVSGMLDYEEKCRQAEKKEHVCDFDFDAPPGTVSGDYKVWNCKHPGCGKWADNWKELHEKENPPAEKKQCKTCGTTEGVDYTWNQCGKCHVLENTGEPSDRQPPSDKPKLPDKLDTWDEHEPDTHLGWDVYVDGDREAINAIIDYLKAREK